MSGKTRCNIVMAIVTSRNAQMRGRAATLCDLRRRGPGRGVGKIVAVACCLRELRVEDRNLGVAALGLRVMRQLRHGLRESAGEGMEAEADYVPPGGANHGAKDHIGLEDFSVGSIDARAPPGLPDVIEQED